MQRKMDCCERKKRKAKHSNRCHSNNFPRKLKIDNKIKTGIFCIVNILQTLVHLKLKIFLIHRFRLKVFLPFPVALKYREIITVKTEILYGKLYLFIKSLKCKKKKPALTSFYFASREIWLGNSKKLICIDQSRIYIFSHPQEFKNV